MIKCFFFDRDGVLIKNYGYLNDISKLKWLKGAINSTKILNKKKIRVIIITNQSGIARGFFTEKELNKFHKMMNFILKKKGGIIDKLYYCPYHPNGKIQKYKRKSNLRKPDNGMLLKAMKQFKLHPSECVMIGDQRSDYLCAKKSKVYFEYKKKYALDIQVNNVLKKFNDK
jgi:D-glycero-D-manno-heptose 1,7-bisphosphate phosphatase